MTCIKTHGLLKAGRSAFILALARRHSWSVKKSRGGVCVTVRPIDHRKRGVL